MQLAGAAFEQLVSRVLGDAPHGGRPAPLAPRAIVGGIWQIAFARLIEGREGELPGMTEELLDWMHSYMFAPGLGLPSPAQAAARPRPQVRFAYLADGTDRGRALAALVRLIRSDGYESLGDARIADDAGITIEAFHDHFASRDACLYALLDGLSDELQGPLADAAHLAGGWPEYVRSALAGLLEHLAGREDLMRVAFLDALDAGPAAAARMMRVVGRLVTRLCQEAPRPRLGGAVASEAVSGALLGVISSCCARGLQRQLPALVDHLSFLVLAPYLGARAAATAIRRS
jgi:AcrR family transcriptional regulator